MINPLKRLNARHNITIRMLLAGASAADIQTETGYPPNYVSWLKNHDELFLTALSQGAQDLNIHFVDLQIKEERGVRARRILEKNEEKAAGVIARALESSVDGKVTRLGFDAAKETLSLLGVVSPQEIKITADLQLTEKISSDLSAALDSISKKSGALPPDDSYEEFVAFNDTALEEDPGYENPALFVELKDGRQQSEA